MKLQLSFVCLSLLWLGAALANAQSLDELNSAPRASAVGLAQAAPPPPPGADPFIKDRPNDGAGPPRAVPVAVPHSESDDAPTEAPIVLTLVLEVFSMDQQTLLSVLSAHADGPQRHAHVLQLLADKKAVLENLAAITTRPGQRCKLGSLHEMIYPTRFHAPDTATQISRPIAFETRILGDSFESEPALGEDGETVDVAILVEESQFSRWVESGLSQRGPIAAQPVIVSRKLSTSCTLTVGNPCCIGTLSRKSVGGLRPCPSRR
ncbi:MAG: hypothetical protein ACKV19_14665 [Verrucomicrobiales bacterium]